MPSLAWRSLTASILVACSACATPPALLPAVQVDAELAIELYPAGTERVELEVGEGVRLRGLFVPGEAGGPVVLHLLESSGSAASLRFHYEPVCRRLQGLGFASLLVDYAGVGASDGERSPSNLRRDARAMWREALARADGDAGRVVLRGTSIGTLAAGLLLEDGIEPGAVVLHVPVLADTAVKRFARAQRGAVVAWFADLWFADVAPVDLAEALARCPAPLLVRTGSEDLFLSDAERERLAAAVLEAGGEWREAEGGHALGTVMAHELPPEELRFLTAVLPPVPLDAARLEERMEERLRDVPPVLADPALRARFRELARLARNADPRLLAAMALANEADVDTLRYLWLVDERGELAELGFGELLEAVALGGPDGRLPVDPIVEASMFRDLNERFGGGGMSENVGTMWIRVRRALTGGDATMTYTVDAGWDSAQLVSDAAELVARLRAAGFADEALERSALRSLLKAARVPERVRLAPDGEPRLEIRESGEWRELDLEGDPPPASFSFHIPQQLGRRARELVKSREVQQ